MAIMLTFSSSRAVEWSGDHRLTTDSDVDWWPSITATTDGEIWVAWRSDRIGNDEIFYRYLDGLGWSPDTRLTWEDHTDNHPSILATSDGKIWVVWDSDRNENDQNIYYKVFDGSEWSPDIQLTTDVSSDAYPSIMQTSDGKIWVIWASPRTGDSEIFCKIFNGTSWSNATQLTTDTAAQDWDPAIMQAADGLIWVVYTKTTGTKNDDIYFKVFDGSEWSNDWQMTFDENFDSHPSILQSIDGRIWIVWNSDRDDNDNIYYKVFDGIWSPETKLTTHSSDDVVPSIAQATDQTIWVVWGTLRGAPLNFDIYYKLNFHDVAITDVTTPETLVMRGETLSIEVTAVNLGTENETFEVQCYANSTHVGSDTISLTPRQSDLLNIQWNTTGATPGVYIISATAVAVPGEGKLHDNSLTDGSVEVRIWGDICGTYEVAPGIWETLPIPDGGVFSNDFLTAVGQFGTGYPTWHPVWGPACDVYKDNVIDIDDLMIIAIHYGET
jgi:hypothetical protein